MKHLSLILFFSSFSILTQAQKFWKPIQERNITTRSGEENSPRPTQYVTFNLNMDGLKTYLANAPVEADKDRVSKALTIQMPMPGGELVNFKVWESSLMEEGLERKYPSIKSYKGYAMDKSGTIMRFAVSATGLHAIYLHHNQEVYIDPYSSKNLDDYIVYDTKYLPEDELYKSIPMCGTDHNMRPEVGSFMPNSRNGAEVEMREYRMAMACTGEWGSVARRGTVEKCLSDINAMMGRLNLLYERDLAVRFKLIADNDKLIFLNPSTDPYEDSGNGLSILSGNTATINRILGSSSGYEIGHVLSVCFDVGGVAQLSSLCRSNKGNGVTCHNTNDLVGIVTRVMSHEVGHQFDASHTWNRCTPSESQRSSGSAVEPGSGSTIMSYAGTCGSDNVVNSEIPFFHTFSIEQMRVKTTGSGDAYGCATKIATGNRLPVVNIPNQKYVIPISTPFELNGEATDEDNDNMTYTWEQIDANGENEPLGTALTRGPLFQALAPSTQTVRFFPNAGAIVTGATLKTEVLPTVTRGMKFRFAARDNSPLGGGVAWKDYDVNSNASAGPFKLIYPLIDDRFTVGQKITITWDVANTDQAPVNCKSVNVYASINGELRTGEPNLIPLALNVPNDGAQEVIIPNRVSNFVRIVVKAADNIFLAAGRSPSRISEPTVPTLFFETNQSVYNSCQPDPAELEISTLGFGGLTGDITFEVLSGLPTGAVATFSSASVRAGEKTTLTINTNAIVGNQIAEIVIKATADGAEALERSFLLNIVGGDINNLQTLSPADALTGGVSLPRYIWNGKKDAINYTVQVANNPSFSPGSIVMNRTVTDTTTLSDVVLDFAKVYYWRVKANNSCKEGEWAATKLFITEALKCSPSESGVRSINITSSGVTTVELPIEVTNDGKVSDINITKLLIDHGRSNDLIVSLIAPSGKEVIVINSRCNTGNIDVRLDDQAPAFLACPINTGKLYRPENPLAAFKDESTKGTWRLKVQDTKPGQGGRLKECNLEICGSVTAQAPVLERNQVLGIHPRDKKTIDNLLLLATDSNNGPEQLRFTITSLPTDGILILNGTDLVLGGTFTQTQINNGLLVYRSAADENGADSFTFIVEDGEGGWISPSTFNINRDKSILNGTSDTNLSSEVSIYPNPTSGNVIVRLDGLASEFKAYKITDVTGKVLMTGDVETNNEVNTASLTKGIYIMTFTSGKKSISKKLIKI